MNFELFIAKRISISKENKKNISGSVLKIAIGAVAIGVAVMILSISVIIGFKDVVHEKIIGISSHINIKNRDLGFTSESIPIEKNQSFYPGIEKISGIKHIQAYAEKSAIIKSGNELQGIIFKGVGTDYNQEFIDKSLVSGRFMQLNDTLSSNEIIISKTLSSFLKLKVGDNLVSYFIQNPIRIRKFEIVGIYESGFDEFDKVFAFCDIKQIQKLFDNKDKEYVSGFEISIDNFNELQEMTDIVVGEVAGTIGEDGSMLSVNNYIDNYPHIFEWLKITDMNVWVILAIMLIVAIFNMIAGLLIIILEKTYMIGLLKALGSSNKSLKKIFLYNGTYLVAKGLLWGNISAFSIIAIQKYTGIIKLDASVYYVNAVPVSINITYFILLNIATLLIATLSLTLPAILVSKIEPVKSIKFN